MDENIRLHHEWTLGKPKGEPAVGSMPLLGCGVCGSKTVKIRGRHPGDNAREVCPTCLAERMDMINEMSSAHYGMACEAQPNNALSKSHEIQPQKEL